MRDRLLESWLACWRRSRISRSRISSSKKRTLSRLQNLPNRHDLSCSRLGKI